MNFRKVLELPVRLFHEAPSTFGLHGSDCVVYASSDLPYALFATLQRESFVNHLQVSYNIDNGVCSKIKLSISMFCRHVKKVKTYPHLLSLSLRDT